MQEEHKKDKIRIGILRGGVDDHYHSSLKKGGEFISYIFENLSDEYKSFDILVDKEGAWHINGVPTEPSKLLYKVDAVWNLSQPNFSNILESFSIPYIGFAAFSPDFWTDREILRKHMKEIGVPMPKQIVSPKTAREVFEKFGSPWIVKNYNEIRVVKTFNELAELINGKDGVIVEEFIAGKVASVHSVPDFRGDLPAQAGDVYTFPLGNTFGNFSTDEKEKLTNLAKDIHTHLGVEHYLKSDFVLTPREKIYLLQVELTPDLKPDSHFSQSAELAGAKMHDVIEHILERVLS